MKSILYVMDALRNDHLSYSGYERETSPRIDDLSTDSVVFSNASSQSTWTRASAGSILTGMYPPANGLVDLFDRFPNEVHSLPEILSENGVKTLGISAMGNVSSTFGFDGVFDEFIDLYKHPKLLKERERVESGKLFQEIGEDQSEVVDPTALDVNNVLFDWLEDHADEDFFVLVWGIDTHSTYDPLPEFRKFSADQPAESKATYDDLVTAKSPEEVEWIRDLYDDLVRQVDHAVGELLDTLDDIGIYDEMTFVLTGDHGEAFGEHGVYGHSTLPIEEIINVPLLMNLPKQRGDSQIINERVEHVDIFPTIARLAETSTPRTVQGESLLPLVDGKTTPGRSHSFTYTNLRASSPSFVSVRTDEWKYIDVRMPTVGDIIQTARDDPRKLNTLVKKSIANWLRYDGEFLFPVDTSVDEVKNVASANPDVLEAHCTLVEEWERACEDVRSDVTRTSGEAIDEQTHQQLKEMGYMD